MKRKLLTVSLSLLLICSVASVASATTSLLIGKKVQKTMNVEVEGKKIKDAIVVDNTTYVPVRSFSEAAGYNLKLEGDDVKLSIETAEKELVDKIKAENQINVLRQNIKLWNTEVEANKELIDQSKDSIKTMEEWNSKVTADDPKMDTKALTERVEKAEADNVSLLKKIQDAEAEIKALEK